MVAATIDGRNVVNLADQFAEHAVTSLDLSRYVLVDAAMKVRDVVGAMNDAGHRCAIVSKGAGPVGIVTDRDVLTRVVGYPMTWEMPVEAVMTPEPESVLSDQSVADALELMNVFRFRNVPVLDAAGALVGNLDRHAFLTFASAELFSDASLDTHDLAAQHGLLFVDFTGLNLPQPITVRPHTDLKRVVHTMRGRGIGSVLVTGEDGVLAGIFTDHDAQTKVACKMDNLYEVPVSDVMTASPVTLECREPIATGLRLMADRNLSHIPLTGSTPHPVAIVSFRDVADYLESTFVTMG